MCIIIFYTRIGKNISAHLIKQMKVERISGTGFVSASIKEVLNDYWKKWINNYLPMTSNCVMNNYT